MLRLLLVALAFTATASAQSPVVEAEDAGAEPAAAALGGGIEYLYDDGAASVNIGPPSSFDPDMLWGNVFERQPGGEVITEIAVAFGSTFPSVATGPVTLWLLADDDGDLDPRTNARLLASATVTPTVFGNTFVRVPIPPTAVGETFFVGASARLLGGQDRPARVDTDGRADRSWFFYAPDIAAVIGSLATAPFGTRMDNTAQVPFPGAFMVRATGVPAATSAEPTADGAGVRLLAPAPNPASAPVVRFELDRPGEVRLEVLDALGRTVAVLLDGAVGAGAQSVRWDARGLPAGVYVVRLQAAGVVRTARAVVPA